MVVRIRTSQRIAPGVSVISYQSPGQYIGGLAIAALLLFALFQQIFGSAAAWVVLVFVAVKWVSAIYRGGLGRKLFWSVILFATCYTVWISKGCVGNPKVCTELQAQREADDRKSAIEQAQKDMEWCATQMDWQNASNCRIYTQKEIDDAKARTAARSAADAADERTRMEQDEQRRLDEAIKNRDLARGGPAIEAPISVMEVSTSFPTMAIPEPLSLHPVGSAPEVPRGSEKPSFDCAKAKTAAARLICADGDLAKLDAQLGNAFRARKAQLPASEQSRFGVAQLGWIKDRNKRCGLIAKSRATVEQLIAVKPCMISLISERIAFLTPTPALPAIQSDTQVLPAIQSDSKLSQYETCDGNFTAAGVMTMLAKNSAPDYARDRYERRYHFFLQGSVNLRRLARKDPQYDEVIYDNSVKQATDSFTAAAEKANTQGRMERYTEEWNALLSQCIDAAGLHPEDLPQSE